VVTSDILAALKSHQAVINVTDMSCIKRMGVRHVDSLQSTQLGVPLIAL